MRWGCYAVGLLRGGAATRWGRYAVGWALRAR